METLGLVPPRVPVSPESDGMEYGLARSKASRSVWVLDFDRAHRLLRPRWVRLRPRHLRRRSMCLRLDAAFQQSLASSVILVLIQSAVSSWISMNSHACMLERDPDTRS